MKMKKRILILAGFGMLLFGSCNKCSHCVVNDSKGNVIKDYGEKCGTSKDVNEYESSAKEDAGQYSGTFDCTGK